MPSPGDATFWGHVPHTLWPFLMIFLVGFLAYQAIKASKHVAEIFGEWGRKIHERAAAPGRTEERVARIEDLLMQTSDKLECATAYLVIDADFHHHADIIIAENYPKLFQLLPKRMAYTEFASKWQEGWRP